MTIRTAAAGRSHRLLLLLLLLVHQSCLLLVLLCLGRSVLLLQRLLVSHTSHSVAMRFTLAHIIITHTTNLTITPSSAAAASTIRIRHAWKTAAHPLLLLLLPIVLPMVLGLQHHRQLLRDAGHRGGHGARMMMLRAPEMRRLGGRVPDARRPAVVMQEQRNLLVEVRGQRGPLRLVVVAVMMGVMVGVVRVMMMMGLWVMLRRCLLVHV